MQTKPRIYTVTQINALVKAALEQGLPRRLIVRGEIRDWKHHHSGHCYFTLKDESGVLPCVMWASHYQGVKFTPEDGMSVLATGYVDVYTVGGKYQLYVEKMEPEGTGALQKAFEQMVAKLRAEGLFEEQYKRAIPSYPQRIAVLTSASGAAFHDIRDSIFQRWPAVTLCFCAVPVQGEGAAQRIAAAIRQINIRKEELRIDLMIVGRGGGSMEDLWAFNEEVLARAIFASRIPVISAVGHEVDITVADLVADARASTPTRAGVVAVPDKTEVLEDIRHLQRHLAGCVRSRLDLGKASMSAILASEMFRRPEVLLSRPRQYLDDQCALLSQLVLQMTRHTRDRLRLYYDQVLRIEPHRLLGQRRLELQSWQNKAGNAVLTVLTRHKTALQVQGSRLGALNPKSVLQRGFSITTHQKTGRLVRRPEDVGIGDSLITELEGDNFIESQVTKK